MRVSLATDTIARCDLEALSQWVLSSSRLTKGPETLAFEGEFAECMGSRYSVFVNSGSSANLLMVAALKESGRLRNAVAIAPAISWVTTVSPLLQLGFDVHLCDADAQSLGLDLNHLEQLFEEHAPSVLILVHVLGHANDLDAIQELCRAHDVFLLEDACEALGSTSLDGNFLGTIGTAGSYSLYYGHHLSTIEGGVVVTDDQEFYRLVVALRSHGWSRDLDDEERKSLAAQHLVDDFRELYTFYYSGYNLRATDLQAFIGRRQLTRLTQVVEARARVDAGYRRALPDFFAQTSNTAVLSPFAFGTLVTDPVNVADRLALAGVESRPLICGNIGRHPFWTKRFGPAALPIADQVHKHGIYLPIHPGMTDEDVSYVTGAFSLCAEPYWLR